MDGFLLVDKPIGWTSHDIVAKVRGIIKSQSEQKVKVGHTGTLDPMAKGLMILVVGNYTKKASEFSKLDKTYEVVMKLGQNSSTGDREGILAKISEKQPSENELIRVLKGFKGEITQTPPMYSAIKINGQRAYKLAREGKKADIEPRKVTIHSINMVSYAYPSVEMIVRVSSGTYIRSLVEDIGKNLGTGAYLSSLTRTEVGKYKLSKSTKLEEINIDKLLKN